MAGMFERARDAPRSGFVLSRIAEEERYGLPSCTWLIRHFGPPPVPNGAFACSAVKLSRSSLLLGFASNVREPCSRRSPEGLRRNGAQERTRTSTPLRAPAPEAGASTNSATWALRRFWQAAALKGRRPALSI